MKRLVALAALAAVAASSAGATTKDARLTVFAAASLTRVLPQIDKDPAYQFAGTNTLAMQIEQGAPVDVFVSASPKYIVELRNKGLLTGKPAWILSNRIVLIVPHGNPARIASPADLRAGMALIPNDTNDGYLQIEFDFTSTTQGISPSLKGVTIAYKCN